MVNVSVALWMQELKENLINSTKLFGKIILRAFGWLSTSEALQRDRKTNFEGCFKHDKNASKNDPEKSQWKTKEYSKKLPSEFIDRLTEESELSHVRKHVWAGHNASIDASEDLLLFQEWKSANKHVKTECNADRFVDIKG